MGGKRLLLVSANRHTEPYPVYPLAISYLSSYMAREMPDLQVYVVDLMTSSYDDLAHRLKELKPHYTGVSLRNIDDVNIYKKESFINHYRKIVDIIRENSESVVIIGGSGFSIYPKLLFETLNPDFGIYGEGEQSLHELITALDEEKDFRDIEGLVYRDDAGVVANRRGTHFKTPVLDFEEELADFYWQNSGMLNIQTKRGCPYSCVYCTYPVIEGHKVRTLDPGQIVKTLTDLKIRKNIDYVFFTDSIFNISNSFNNDLAAKLVKANLNIRWGAYFNFTNIDKDLLARMKEAGLKHIEFGTDSISDPVLEKCNKPFRVEDILRISDYCTELDIDYAHFLILGGYGETEDTVNETFENSKKITRSVFFPFIGMRIYPGTKLHEIAVEEKVVGRGDLLLEPVYYVSKEVDISRLKEKAATTGKAWIFPDDDLGNVMVKMRQRNKKGPLWEYLVK